jgi:HEAT repeat protein
VLAHSADPEQRVMAAYIVGYAAELQPVVPDLQSALQDPDPSVRANAARALRGIIWLAMREPDRGLRVQPTWFVEMLNSVDLSDRLEASRALLLFTEKPDEHTAANIRDRALPSLLEMAAWKHLPHALPAYLVAGRLAGMTDEDLQAAWEKGDRDKTLAAIRKALSRRPGR